MLPTLLTRLLPDLALRKAITSTCLPLALGVLSLACSQGEGDRCEIDSDCSTGLICVLNQGRSDGTCRTSAAARPVDAAPDRPSPDAPADRAIDLAPDAGPDRPPADASPDAGPDLGPDGPTDAIVAPDVGGSGSGIRRD